MKKSNNNQSILANVVINEKMFNEKYALKYINKQQMQEECNKLGEAIGWKSVPENLSKKSYMEIYNDMVAKYHALSAEPVKEAKAEKKASKKVKEEKPVSEGNNAQARLDKYTAELKEKEAIKNPSKEVKHRIASLKRKIARAEKALTPKTSVDEYIAGLETIANAVKVA